MQKSRLLRDFFPVFEKLLDPGIGKRMLGKLHHDAERDGRHIGADKGGVQHMDRVADAGDDDLGIEAVVVENGPDIFDDPHAVLGDVIQAADKRGDVGRSGIKLTM